MVEYQILRFRVCSGTYYLGFGFQQKNLGFGKKSLRVFMVVRGFYSRKETVFFSVPPQKNWIRSAFDMHLVQIFGHRKSPDQFSHQNYSNLHPSETWHIHLIEKRPKIIKLFRFSGTRGQSLVPYSGFGLLRVVNFCSFLGFDFFGQSLNPNPTIRYPNFFNVRPSPISSTSSFIVALKSSYDPFFDHGF